MGIIGDVCRKITTLAPAQIELLDKLSGIFPLVCDLAHAQLTVYTKSGDENLLVIAAQLTPNTSFSQYKPNLLGTTVYAVEEPLIWRTMSTGQPISGKREWALGMLMEMQTYPVHDYEGNIIAVVSFETSPDEMRTEGYGILLDTAYTLLTHARSPFDVKLYRPLSASDGIIITDERGKIIFANAAASSIYKVLGIGRIVGRHIYDRQINMRVTRKTTTSQMPYETELETGNLILVQRTIPIIHAGQVIRTVIIVADVTELKKKEKELLIKSAVIQEIHHRVKNNLQTIASLLRLQARRTDSPQVKAALRESVNRILSISVVHEFLSQQDAEIIDVAEVAKNILDLVIQNMLEPDFNLQTIFNGETVILPSEQASSLALVINELIQNSIEHGFIGRPEGLIGVDIATNPGAYRIEIYDNGIGLPANFSSQKSKSLGLQIVRTLIEDDLGGTFELYADQGTHARITIPRTIEGGR